MSLPAVLRSRATWLALCLAFWPARALAQTQAKPSDPPVAETHAAAPLRVWVEGTDAAFDRAALQQSLARELGREIVLAPDAGASDVQIRLDGAARAEVRYTTASGEKLMRSVALPPDRERSLQVVSWLTVNLVRDEASELIDELRARHKEEAEARAAADKAAADKATADKAAADKAAADKAAADKAAADKARAEAARRKQLATAAATKPGPLLRDPLRSFDLALATPLSLVPDSKRRELHLQAALAYGDSGAIRGLAFSPAVLRTRQELNGAAVALAFLLAQGDVHGAVASLGYARVEGQLGGVQLGVGVASARAMQGIMAAGGLTLLRDTSRGIQLSTGINMAGDLTGIQLASGVNVAREFRGIALAPVNVQQRVHGLQLGLINIAEDVDGAAIGIVSLAKNGRLQPVLWGSADRSIHVALKSIAGLAFTELGGGVELNGARGGYDAGIGAHLRLSEHFFLEPGVFYSGVYDTRSDSNDTPDQHRLYYLVQGGFRAGDKLDLLLAAGVRHITSGAGADAVVAPELRGGVAFF